MAGVEFNGFGKDSLKFLKALGFYQDREWFKENKQIYLDEVRGPMGDLIEALSDRFEKANIPLKGDRKKSLYRVNRDVRFSKNKDPYVTHASAMLTRDGTKKDNGFVYMHFSNERSFIAAGFYGMQGDQIRAFRELLCRESDKVAEIVASMEKHGYVFDTENALKRIPRGFEKVGSEPLLTWIKQRNFVFTEELAAKDFISGAVEDHMFEMGKRAGPLLEFGWRALERKHLPWIRLNAGNLVLG